MRKSEMEFCSSQYNNFITNAKSSRKQEQYPTALELAENSCTFLDGHLQYERRHFGNAVSRLDGLSLILALAPILLRTDSLDRVEQILTTNRRIAKPLLTKLSDTLQDSREALNRANALFGTLEEVDFFPITTSEFHSLDSRGILHFWERCGLVRRHAIHGIPGLSLVTRMSGIVPAKCPSCGSLLSDTKWSLLNTLTCRQCLFNGEFVFIPDDNITTSQDN